MAEAHGHDDDDKRSRATRILAAPLEPRASFAATFKAIFRELHPIYTAFDKDGLLCVAAREDGKIASYVHLPILSEQGAFGVIGRHECCALTLQDEDISLRHALVRVSRQGIGEARVRLIDLDSSNTFRTEDGQVCKSVLAEGPLFVHMLGYQLFLFPTGSLAPSRWESSADATWDSFPERVYLDHRIPERVNREQRRPQPAGRARRHTYMTLLPAAQHLRAKPGAGGKIVGTILLSAENTQIAHRVSAEDLERGMLIGRYERCQLAGASHSLSRVHLVLLLDGGDIWAVDTASLNGTIVDGQKISAIVLDRELELKLPAGMGMRWVPEHIPPS
ncbi:FHA domain-containing protein [Nannocystis punicea]|uniref:FHA domain-containing protein n=1 Tax=Nannocystis punicea TaxID=2995304 RepID=A0ABY7GTZ5_9BACT|nr:FHA domain-containing protein [Nannocystis poenicansa]WAS90406.1 FHA domain-containing protein [Nannocystis poenicansa]